jgi:hypothetical protein
VNTGKYQRAGGEGQSTPRPSVRTGSAMPGKRLGITTTTLYTYVNEDGIKNQLYRQILSIMLHKHINIAHFLSNSSLFQQTPDFPSPAIFIPISRHKVIHSFCG